MTFEFEETTVFMCEVNVIKVDALHSSMVLNFVTENETFFPPQCRVHSSPLDHSLEHKTCYYLTNVQKFTFLIYSSNYSPKSPFPFTVNFLTVI